MRIYSRVAKAVSEGIWEVCTGLATEEASG